MILVTVEIVPFGVEDHERRREIATLRIGLDGTSECRRFGRYTSTCTTDGKFEPPNPVIQIDRHDRSLGALPLIKDALWEHLNGEVQETG
jgi:hypothetical protein